MPYGSVTEAVKKHPNLNKYSNKAKDAWVKAFNNAWKTKPKEEYAFAVAYSVANKMDNKKASVARELIKLSKRLISDDALSNIFFETQGYIARSTGFLSDARSNIEKIQYYMNKSKRKENIELQQMDRQIFDIMKKLSSLNKLLSNIRKTL